MGYRSTVAYMITGTKGDILSFVAECRLTHPETELALNEVKVATHIHHHTEQTYIAYYADDVKWDDDYAEVKSHNALWELAELAEENKYTDDFSGLFIRLGEDNNDIEEKEFGEYAPYDYLSFNRSLSLDLDLEAVPDLRDSAPCPPSPTPTSMHVSTIGATTT